MERMEIVALENANIEELMEYYGIDSEEIFGEN